MFHTRHDKLILGASLVPIAFAVYAFLQWHGGGGFSVPLFPGGTFTLPALPVGITAAIQNAEAWRVPGMSTALGATGLALVVVAAGILAMLTLMLLLDLVDAVRLQLTAHRYAEQS